jgi:hypothetical protein
VGETIAGEDDGSVGFGFGAFRAAFVSLAGDGSIEADITLLRGTAVAASGVRGGSGTGGVVERRAFRAPVFSTEGCTVPTEAGARQLSEPALNCEVT